MTKKTITDKQREELIYNTCRRLYRGDINTTQFNYLLSQVDCNPQEAIEITRKFEVNQTFLVVVECLVILAVVLMFSLGLSLM